MEDKCLGHVLRFRHACPHAGVQGGPVAEAARALLGLRLVPTPPSKSPSLFACHLLGSCQSPYLQHRTQRYCPSGREHEVADIAYGALSLGCHVQDRHAELGELRFRVRPSGLGRAPRQLHKVGVAFASARCVCVSAPDNPNTSSESHPATIQVSGPLTSSATTCSCAFSMPGGGAAQRLAPLLQAMIAYSTRGCIVCACLRESARCWHVSFRCP